MSSFNTINTALGGLRSNLKAIEVTGHNVANVNTAGYHRQEVLLRALPPSFNSGSAQSQVGTGVEVSMIRRMQNSFLARQTDQAHSQMGRWQMLSDSLQQIESYLAPGQGLDLSSMLDRFFAAWQGLATHPEDIANRLNVRGAAVAMASALNDQSRQLDLLDHEVTVNLHARVDQLNDLADQLAELNVQIGMAQAAGQEPNDYLDQRDMVLSEMTRIAGITAMSNDPVSGITALEGHPLVAGPRAFHLRVDTSDGTPRLRWEDDMEAIVTSGEIGALYETRNTVIPAYQGQLDTLARALADAVNALHTTGVTMYDAAAGAFFEGETAGSLRVADAILEDAGYIAATTVLGAPGDGSLATDIYAIQNQALIEGQTLHQRAQGLISQVGNAIQTAGQNLTLNSSLYELLLSQQQQESGVSLDEEMANLLLFQRAYDASARVLTTADEMLQTLLERM